jgi:phosphotransferase system enzyme I (PtsI)
MSEGERVLRVTPGSPGIAVGPAALWRSPAAPPAPGRAAGGSDEESARLAAAVESARGQLREIRARIAAAVGEAEARLFRSHLALLEDPLVMGPVRDGIRQGALSAEEAVQGAVAALVARFEALKDPRLRERAADIRDVGQRLLHNLAGGRPADAAVRPGSVVCAETITPSEVSLLAHAAVGLVLAEGGPTSHSVILARALGLPVVLGARSVLDRVREGDPLVVDGAGGSVVLHPAPATAGWYRARTTEGRQEAERQPVGRDEPTLTLDGHRVVVMANIAGAEEVAAARVAGAEGVGLLRTEFLFLDRARLPSEEEQLAAYREVLAQVAPLRVVFRVLDAGADKPLPALSLRPEPNPSLGLRGIRLCLRHDEIFRTQLRALLRASRHGELAILLPLVSDVDEVRQVRRLLDEVQRDIAPEGGAPAVPLGVMVETPAAALMAAELAQEADFLSIGTNDLVQYVLAVDRQSGTVAELYQPFHPAVLRLLRHVCEAAAARGRPTSICGEMAADPLAVPLLVELGIGTLSVAPSAVAAVKKAVRGLSRTETRGLVDEVAALATPAEAVERLRRFALGEGRSRVHADHRHR